MSSKSGSDYEREQYFYVMSGAPDWDERDGALERTLSFPSFPAAIAFVNRVAELAERENHHPAIAVDYRTVTIRWTTHSAGGVTERDRALAAETDQLLDAQ
jgi:4a-hydroxytetrahydrobiopterin dehydratase